MSALPPIATAKADSRKSPCLLYPHMRCNKGCPLRAKSGLMQRSKQLDRPELQVGPALRTARTVVEVRPLVTAVHYRSESVETVHDRLHKDQGIVRRAEGGLQVPNGLDDERSCRCIATEHLRKIGIRPVGDVVVRLIFAEVAAFDRISAVVDQENHRLVVVP